MPSFPTGFGPFPLVLAKAIPHEKLRIPVSTNFTHYTYAHRIPTCYTLHPLQTVRRWLGQLILLAVLVFFFFIAAHRARLHVYACSFRLDHSVPCSCMECMNSPGICIIAKHAFHPVGCHVNQGLSRVQS